MLNYLVLTRNLVRTRKLSLSIEKLYRSIEKKSRLNDILSRSNEKKSRLNKIYFLLKRDNFWSKIGEGILTKLPESMDWYLRSWIATLHNCPADSLRHNRYRQSQLSNNYEQKKTWLYLSTRRGHRSPNNAFHYISFPWKHRWIYLWPWLHTSEGLHRMMNRIRKSEEC